MRLGILTSHPIQYQAPWFRGLAKVVDLEVFFCHRQSAAEQGKAGFGVAFEWDVDLLSGYNHRFLKNVSSRPSVDNYAGCDTPEIADIVTGKQKTESRKQKTETPCALLPAPCFDAFIVTGWHLKSYWQAVRACRRAGVPVLVRGDSQLHTPRSWLKRWGKEILYRPLLRQFDGFLVVGQRNRDYLAHYGVPKEKMFFAPHFVDNEFFKGNAEILKAESRKQAGEVEDAVKGEAGKQKAEILKAESRNQPGEVEDAVKGRAEIRKELKIPPDAFCVLFCGKFIPKKRPLDLVEAAKLLLEDRRSKMEDGRAGSLPHLQSSIFHLRPLHLLFVGSGELGRELRAACDVVFDAETPSLSASDGERAGVSCSPLPSLPPASFAGFKNQSELPRYYAAADALVLPSDGGETWGLVVNEAMACGLPAIVSDAVGCAPDLIEEGKTGFAFPLGDCSELARRIQSLAEMKGRGHDFSSALAEKMRVYSVNTAAERTVEAIQKLKC